jgi:putative methionine-R-sulfoxide reductase with GAF domain
MGRMIYDYTKSSLERSFNEKEVFIKELKKASKVLMPHEIEKLMNWLHFFVADKPELKEAIESLNLVLVS